MKYEFEKAKEEDIPLLFRLNRELIDAYEDISSIDYDRVLSWVKRNIQANISNFTRVTLEGIPAAYYCLSPEKAGWELDSLFVLPPYQNRGIGTAILNKCILETKGNLYLYVFRKNTRALALYRRLGFEVTEEVGKTRYVMTYEKSC